MNLSKRKRNRLSDYDYSENGAYFVTVCTQNRICCLSKIVTDGAETKLIHTKAGQFVDHFIREIPNKYPTVSVEHAVVMPNHVHLLIMIHRNGGTGDPSPTVCAEKGGTGDPSPTLGNVIGWFKYQTTKAINEGLTRQPGQFWQRSYYDHVVRDEEDFLIRWNYIEGNPSRWENDEYHT
jgi:REP element-mobilizing transposase RayT